MGNYCESFKMKKMGRTNCFNEYQVITGPNDYKLLIADFERLYPDSEADVITFLAAKYKRQNHCKRKESTGLNKRLLLT